MKATEDKVLKIIDCFNEEAAVVTLEHGGNVDIQIKKSNHDIAYVMIALRRIISFLEGGNGKRTYDEMLENIKCNSLFHTFLVENKILDSYIEQYDPLYKGYIFPLDINDWELYISCAFDGDKSQEGYDFWYDLDIAWLETIEKTKKKRKK